MALDDRDYMRDRVRNRNGYTERSWFRRSMAGEKDYRYNPKLFRGSINHDQVSSWSKGGNWWRAVVFFLAIYGTVSLLRDLHTWSEQKKKATAAQLQTQARDKKEAAWARFYQQPDYCNFSTGQAWQQCLADRTEARRRFERLYADGAL